MRHPWANLALLTLVAVELASGLAGLLGATGGFRVAFWIHAVGAYGLFVVVFAKAALVGDAVGRRPGFGPARWVLALAAVLLLATLLTGMLWITGGRRVVAGISIVNWHAYLGLALAVPLVWHALDRRWVVQVPRAADRGAFLRIAGLAAVGAALWQAEGLLQRALGLPGSRRRWTGSYEVGSLGGDFPATSWLDDDPAPVDPSSWRLEVTGAVATPLSLGHAQVASIADAAVEATLDCTGGWYSRQVWQGVPLARLLDLAGVADGAQSVLVESVTGYGRRFSLGHARELVLATAVAGAPLSHGHGFPARLVVPSRRGFDWVKWVVKVEVLESHHLVQPPLPVT